jgi:putative transposase
LGISPTCEALGLPRATFYRSLEPSPVRLPRPSPPRALSEAEEQGILALLRSERFVDLAPTAIFATLLGEGTYVCSVSTMYRLLREHGETRERRNVLRHPEYEKPELLATGPNQVWSWDITKLLGPAKWTYFYLYVVLDVFSRYVPGWMLADKESSALAKRLLGDSARRENIQPGQLTIHADRGTSMTSKPVAGLMGELGITRSHSRPHNSNDNPFSESQFKTLKYRPAFPKRFADKAHADDLCSRLFDWYNNDHHHVGLGLHTPHDVHRGLAAAKQLERARVLRSAYEALISDDYFCRRTTTTFAGSAVSRTARGSPASMWLADGHRRAGPPAEEAPHARQDSRTSRRQGGHERAHCALVAARSAAVADQNPSFLAHSRRPAFGRLGA